VTAGFRPALWACAIFALLAVLTSVAIAGRAARVSPDSVGADVLMPA
jgi:hypothetical protein